MDLIQVVIILSFDLGSDHRRDVSEASDWLSPSLKFPIYTRRKHRGFVKINFSYTFRAMGVTTVFLLSYCLVSSFTHFHIWVRIAFGSPELTSLFHPVLYSTCCDSVPPLFSVNVFMTKWLQVLWVKDKGIGPPPLASCHTFLTL